jgi:hypothetical protein
MFSADCYWKLWRWRLLHISYTITLFPPRSRHGRDRLVVEFTTTYAISAFNHWSCEFESCSWRGVLHTTLCDKVCHWLATCQWFSPGSPVSTTNKTDSHDITELLLKVALITITPQKSILSVNWWHFLPTKAELNA